MLDNFALLSGQISMLTRLIKSERIPQLRGYVLLPLVLSPERDAELEVTQLAIYWCTGCVIRTTEDCHLSKTLDESRQLGL